MDQDKLIDEINSKGLIRTHGFPFLMPLIKGMYKDGKDTQEVQDSIRVMVSNHVEAKHEKIMEKLGYYVQKAELKRAFLAMIDRDFIKLGLPREEIALKALKASNPKLLWSGDVDLEIEKQGIDITGNGYAIGISVKGLHYRNARGYMAHRKQLLDNKFKACYIAFVDEESGKISWERVKNNNG